MIINQLQVQYDQKQARNGMFCYPKNEKVKQQFLINSDLGNRDNFMKSLDNIIICMVLSVAMSIIYLLLVQFLPFIMNYFSVVVGTLAMIALIVCVALYETTYVKSKWFIFTLFLLLVVITIATVFMHRGSLKIHGIFLNQATKMICDRIHVVFYIPLFLILTTIFIILILLEFKSFWGSGNTVFNPQKNLYYQLVGATPVLLTILWFIQVIWGLSFLKQAYNFCISGAVVQWYYDTDQGFLYPIKLLFLKHLGTVIAGSFMTGFFSIFDYLFDFIKPDDEDINPGCYSHYFNKGCTVCLKVFELVRSDAMAYINLTSNPYCNSSRYCQYLCLNSLLMDNSQSTSRTYRICSHFLIAGLIAILGMYIKGSISMLIVAIIIAMAIFLSTYFISLHADAAEAIQIIMLQDEQFAKREEQHRDTKFDRNNILTAFNVKKRRQLAQELKVIRAQQNQARQKAKAMIIPNSSNIQKISNEQHPTKMLMTEQNR